MQRSKTFRLLAKALSRHIPVSRIYSGPLQTLARGTDAGFYRLIPGLVVRVDSEQEVVAVLVACESFQVPVTFKAGGTSLSGQTITDSLLVETGNGFSGCTVLENGRMVSMQCGITGGLVNARLARHGRRIGPDPSSLNSARIGGIVSNNASGGAFGIRHNSYNTMRGIRLIMSDGSLLDTRDLASRQEFARSHVRMLDELSRLASWVRSDTVLKEKIHHKYRLKNTCGYGLNSLVDFDDPVDILEHLIVGAEGTLGFISEVTFETVEDYPLKATALVFFPSLREASQVTLQFTDCRITAAEIMDRNALRSVQDRPGMPGELHHLDPGTAALLIDTSAHTKEELDLQVSRIKGILSSTKTVYPVEFTDDRARYEKLWKVRKGLFTSAAAARPAGTACIIEDLAFSTEAVPDAMEDLRNLTEKWGYHDTVIWGHIMDGNIHFVITPDFSKSGSLDDYNKFMHEVVDLTLHRHDGSLKGEHGTGRNMAPFVREEWGDDLYGVMQEIKRILDPGNLLNPGVILNDDPEIHLKNIKSFPTADPIIDPCIECGFCEVSCPSKNLTLTPRQRIVVYREMSRLSANHRQTGTFRALKKAFQYQGDATCATDGLCAIACPVEINTGKLIKDLRFINHSKVANWIADRIAGNMGKIINVMRGFLALIAGMHRLTGTRVMTSITRWAHMISGRKIPLWNPFMPGPAERADTLTISAGPIHQVVYFPACINRALGKSADQAPGPGLIRKTIQLLQKAGFEILLPENLDELCCGMAFDSKGFKRQGEKKARELESALLHATQNGRIPVYCDMSPCLLRMKEILDKRLHLYEPVEFILTYFPGKVRFTQIPDKIAIHATCSSITMGLDRQLVKLAGMCAREVVVPDEVGCCGWAGDRGFTVPRLNASALKMLRSQLPADLSGGYSTSRTCEIGLSLHSGISYRSIVYLVDKATQPLNRSVSE